MNFRAAPSPLEVSLSEATRLLQAGKWQRASALLAELIPQHPVDPRPLGLMAHVHLLADKPDRALVCLEHALALAPSDPSLIIRAGQCLARLGRRREALLAAERASHTSLPSAALHDGLGTLWTHCDEPTRGLPYHEKAVQLQPDSVDFRYNLATVQRMVGQLEAAEASLDAVITLAPHFSAAYLTRADVRRQTSERNHVDQIDRQLASPDLSVTDRITLSFAKAKELEDLARHEESFQTLTEGCRLQRARTEYSVRGDVETMEALRRHHTHEALASGAPGLRSDEPIFIIGLPRSGTTLVESLLSSHPDVLAAGELPAFPKVCAELLARGGAGQTTKVDFATRALSIPAAALGQAYIDATRPQTGSRKHFIDKLPLNYLYAGLIHRALPTARIICLERDPMDSCYAMYKTLFTAAYPFSYDLDDLAEYYCAWRELMDHWEQTLGDRWLRVRYEHLVTDPVHQTARILNHCGLSPHDACLSFSGREGGVSTASASQVRQPIYRTSIGRWRAYASQLAPLAAKLAPIMDSPPPGARDEYT